MTGLIPIGRFDWERIIRRIHAKPSPSCAPGRVHMPWDARSLLLLYATYGAADGTRIFPGDKRIITIIGKSSTTIRRWRDTPVRLGLLTLAQHGGGSGQYRRANEYRLTVPDDLLDRFCLLDPDTEEPPEPFATVPAWMGTVERVGTESLRPPGAATVPTGERTVPESGGHCARPDGTPSRDQGDQPSTKGPDRHLSDARARATAGDDPEYASARAVLATLNDLGGQLLGDVRAALPHGEAMSDRNACITAAELVRGQRNGRRARGQR